MRAVARRALTRMSELAILSSPYRRAMHTAQIAAIEAGASQPILEVGALTPDSSPAEAWNEVKLHCNGKGPVLLVGHEPLFSSLTAYLLGAPDLALEFGTATLACVEMPSGVSRPRGSLKWLMPAKLAKFFLRDFDLLDPPVLPVPPECPPSAGSRLISLLKLLDSPSAVSSW